MQAWEIEDKSARSAVNRLTPYELSLYLLMCELERIHQQEDGLSELDHAVYGRSLVPLFEIKHLSMPVLLCFLARFEQANPSDMLAARFLQKVCACLEYGAVPVSNEGHRSGVAFAARHSIVGMFMRRVERNYAAFNFSSRMAMDQLWMDYARAPPLSEELVVGVKEWGWNFEELMSGVLKKLGLSIMPSHWGVQQ